MPDAVPDWADMCGAAIASISDENDAPAFLAAELRRDAATVYGSGEVDMLWTAHAVKAAWDAATAESAAEVERLRAERDALRAVVDCLDQCEHSSDCSKPATLQQLDGVYFCDVHGMSAYCADLPYAAALRAYEGSRK